MRRLRARYSAIECRPPRRNKSGTAEVNAPLSLNTETKALFHNLPLFEPAGAGNLPLRNVTVLIAVR